MAGVRLEDTSIFKNIRAEVARGLLGHFTHRALDTGSEVFCQGDPGDALVVLIEGSFDLIRQGSMGEVHLAILHPGTVLGHISLIDGGPRSATLRTNEPSRIATLDRETFEQLWQSPSPDAVQLQLRVTQLIIEELRLANRKLSGLLDVPLADTPETIRRLMGVVDKARERTGNR